MTMPPCWLGNIRSLRDVENDKKATLAGFEPTRRDVSRLAIYRLSHSATVSMLTVCTKKVTNIQTTFFLEAVYGVE